MQKLSQAVGSYLREGGEGWNRFWFTPLLPHTLAVIRICTGLMVFYTLLVWTKDFSGFFTDDGRISREFALGFHSSSFAWSHFFWIENLTLLYLIHFVSLAVVLCLAAGWKTRVMSVATFLIVNSYVHRVPGTLFGLDQINSMLVMYLMLGGSGDVFSLDSRLRRLRRGPVQATVMNNIATRLIQLHMCLIYMFAGLGKVQGASWWEGRALWLAIANYEYQSLDMTWLANWPLLINLATHVTVAWEISYSALIWPRWTRPLMLALAVPVHLGIAFTMGMITFGAIMIVGNLAFVSPQVWRRRK